MAGTPRTPTGRALVALGSAAFFAWAAFVVIELLTLPEPGAPSVDALASWTASSLDQRDADALQALLVGDAPDDYAEQLLAGLPSGRSGPEGVVQHSGRGEVIVVREPAGRGTCVVWQVVHEEGRYLLGVVPPFDGC